ncbi:hypothetical protein [Fodinicola acaciae]|uniref:hypothetical protein n=1 Tax=Fodinicola acaciae TaxID=2681555 RepID=UPI001C9E52B9|nr:hypothetical protein [Fodinicola acaciae]
MLLMVLLMVLLVVMTVVTAPAMVTATPAAAYPTEGLTQRRARVAAAPGRRSESTFC